MEKKSSIAEWRNLQSPKLSQEQFGALLHPPVDKWSISRWEAKHPPIERLVEIADLIECDVRDLAPPPNEAAA